MLPSTELMFTQNSAAEAEQLGISRPDCLRAIATSGVIKSEQLGPDWRRTVRGKDMDGNTITLVVTVVPTMDGKRKRIVVLKTERNDTKPTTANTQKKAGLGDNVSLVQ